MKSLVLMLLIVQGVLSKYIDIKSGHCSESNINHIKRKYIREIEEEVEDLKKIEEITSDCSRNVESALRQLRRDIENARPSSGEGVNINKCLDELYHESNAIENSYQETLDKKCYSKVDSDIAEVNAKVDKAISKIERCAEKPGSSCDRINECCEDVEEHFSDEDVDDDIEDLVRVYKKCVSRECRKIEDEINKLTSKIKICTDLTEPQETTTPMVTVPPITEDPLTPNVDLNEEDNEEE